MPIGMITNQHANQHANSKLESSRKVYFILLPKGGFRCQTLLCSVKEKIKTNPQVHSWPNSQSNIQPSSKFIV